MATHASITVSVVCIQALLLLCDRRWDGRDILFECDCCQALVQLVDRFRLTCDQSMSRVSRVAAVSKSIVDDSLVPR